MFACVASSPPTYGMTSSRQNMPAVMASKAKPSRLAVCGGGFVWIASLSLAMTIPPTRG
jgi:hypothetical protein